MSVGSPRGFFVSADTNFTQRKFTSIIYFAAGIRPLGIKENRPKIYSRLFKNQYSIVAFTVRYVTILPAKKTLKSNILYGFVQYNNVTLLRY